MSDLYKAPDGSPNSRLSVLFGLLAALLIFLLVPLSQYFRLDPVERIDPIEAVALAPPPPPPPVKVEELPRSEPTEVSLPQFEAPPPLPNLEQLELSLQPGIGGDLSIEVGLNLDFQTESAQQLADLFDFEDLDALPSLLRRGQPRMPQPMAFNRLMQQGGLKQVTLVVVVDERGAVQVTDVLNYTHEVLVPAAKQAAERSRFSQPLVNGQPVRAKYIWQLSF